MSIWDAGDPTGAYDSATLKGPGLGVETVFYRYRIKPGRWKMPSFEDGSNTSTLAFASGRLFFTPFMAEYPFTFDAVSAYGLAVSAPTVRAARFALFSSDPDHNAAPLAKVAELGSVEWTTTGVKTVTFAPVTVQPSIYYIATKMYAYNSSTLAAVTSSPTLHRGIPNLRSLRAFTAADTNYYLARYATAGLANNNVIPASIASGSLLSQQYAPLVKLRAA